MFKTTTADKITYSLMDYESATIKDAIKALENLQASYMNDLLNDTLTVKMEVDPALRELMLELKSRAGTICNLLELQEDEIK